jgi:hypothetical protein
VAPTTPNTAALCAKNGRTWHYPEDFGDAALLAET